MAELKSWGFTRPVRLVTADFYRDGGTILVRLRGANGFELDCGLGTWIGSAKGRMFYSGVHPDIAGTAFVRLWSAEEAGWLALIREAVRDSISADLEASLLRATSVAELPDEKMNGLWHLVRALNLRQRTHTSVQSGHLTSTEDALTYAGLSGRLDLRTIQVYGQVDSIEVVVRDSTGKDIAVRSHGYGFDREMCLWTIGDQIPSGVTVLEGGHWTSRVAITLIEYAMNDPLAGTRGLKVRFKPRDLRGLEHAVNRCKRWFLEGDYRVGP